MKKVLDILKDASAEQRSRVKEAVQAAMQDGSLQVEFLLKEKNSKILQLEQDRHKLKEKLHHLERVSSPIGSDTARALQQKDDEMLALQTGAKKVVDSLQREKVALQKELRRLSDPTGSGTSDLVATQHSLDEARRQLAAAAEREAALSKRLQKKETEAASQNISRLEMQACLRVWGRAGSAPECTGAVQPPSEPLRCTPLLQNELRLIRAQQQAQASGPAAAAGGGPDLASVQALEQRVAAEAGAARAAEAEAASLRTAAEAKEAEWEKTKQRAVGQAHRSEGSNSHRLAAERA